MSLAWLPYADRTEAERRLGTIPASIDVDFYRDRGTTLPEGVEEVAFLVLPPVRGHAALDPMARMRSLEVVQAFSAGFDEYLPLVPEHVTFCNAAGVNDTSVAESAVGLVLASGHRIDEYARNMPEGRWQPTPGQALADKRVLIVGYGRIGHAIEERLRPFETASITRISEHASAGPPQVHPTGELPDLLPHADVVILIVPLTPDTHHLIGRTELDLMPDGALLVNVARGPVVDTRALVDVLGTDRIRAALDVTDPEPLPPDHPLWTAPGVLITPHAAGQSSAQPPRMDRLIREQLRRFAAGEPLLNVIPRHAPART